MLAAAASSEPITLVVGFYLLPGYGLRAQTAIDLILVFLFVALSNSILLLPLFEALLRRFLGSLSTLRLPLRDVIFNFVQDIRVGLDAVLMVVDEVLLSLAGPRVLADHVEVGVDGLLEALVLLE